jgi:hypothetical protein
LVNPFSFSISAEKFSALILMALIFLPPTLQKTVAIPLASGG